ncbi:MAG: DUF262 domain-containing HNH endonuclease family protein [Alphaproteobacteria bacterium]|nr:DUF262 domain-containing HNH endonuclease family protein [Alphaproteobacteria bacterium]
MTSSSFSSSNQTYRKLMGNGMVYKVPPFQRDYSWEEEQWDNLWQDLMAMIEGKERSHYLGYLVLQSTDDRNFLIIDGQQRVTTLSLIVLAAMFNLSKLIKAGVNPENSQSRLNSLRNIYIGFQDPVSLLTRPKLELNRANNQYYQNNLVELKEVLPMHHHSASAHVMRKAFLFYCEKIEKHTEMADDRSKAIAEFIELISDRLFFTVMNLTDELNAYVVFETLNARGVPLSATDMLKNYLFTVLYDEGRPPEEFKKIEEDWSGISLRIQESKLLDFVRVHWNSRNSLVRKLDLYKTIRQNVTKTKHVFQLLSNMESDIDSYQYLQKPESSIWNEVCRNYAKILKVFKITQAHPAIIAARRVMGDQEFERFLKLIVIVSFRYNVICGLNPNDLEKVYGQIRELCNRQSDNRTTEILSFLKSIYPTHDQFVAAFKEKIFTVKNNRPLVHYILKSLDDNRIDTEPAKAEEHCTIEHIVPTHPAEGQWTAFDQSDLEYFSSRIGNLLQLEELFNRDIGNREFLDKKAIYAKSKYRLTREVAEKNSDWTVSHIEWRLNEMAKHASQLWKIEQLEK